MNIVPTFESHFSAIYFNPWNTMYKYRQISGKHTHIRGSWEGGQAHCISHRWMAVISVTEHLKQVDHL